MSKLSPPPSSSPTDTILYQPSEEGITQIVINRPSRRNAVDSQTGQKLYEAFIAFDKDETQRVCILSGMLDQFCAGFDLHEAAGMDHVDGKEPKRSHLQSVSFDDSTANLNRAPMGPSRLALSKPLIAAVAGYAVAGGLELSLLADMRIVEEDAIFGVFCRRFGVPLIDGGTVRLPAVVGLGRAMDMILTGRPVGAHEALQFGLANRVVPSGNGNCVKEALSIARRLLAFPQLCMNLDRRSTYYAAFQASSLQDALAFEFDQGVQCLDTESIKGAASFSTGAAGRHGGFQSGSDNNENGGDPAPSKL